MAKVQLSQQAAVKWVGSHAWKKGQSYVRGLTGLTAQPDGDKLVLQASAHGQEKYTVRITLAGHDIQKAHCSCPVGGSGDCKHVAALLARATQSPDDFSELSDLTDVLNALDADDLRRLVRLMLEREPNFTRLVLTQSGKAGGRHRSDLQQRIEDALSLVDYDPEEDWEGEGLDLSDFMPLIDELKAGLASSAQLDLAAQGDLLAACLALLNGAKELQNDEYGVETDDLFEPARTGLLQLLQHPLDAKLREMALEALQDSIDELGWLRGEVEDQFELFADLPNEERQQILSFVRQLLSKAKESYVKRNLNELLFVLTAEENLSFEEEMALAKATEDQEDIVHVLFKHERIDEAIKTLSASGKPLAPQQVESYFDERDLLHKLEEYAQQNLEVFGSRAWLYGRYRATGRQKQAYALASEAVFKGTGQHQYFVSRFLAQDLDWLAELKASSPDWPSDREKYIAQQWKKPDATDHLMQFLLQEGLLERAEELVARDGKGSRSGVSAYLIRPLALRLPAERAKPLILRAAALYVDGGERKYYQLAAETLSEAAALIGRDEAKAIAKLLVRDNPKRRALADELSDAGLI